MKNKLDFEITDLGNSQFEIAIGEYIMLKLTRDDLLSLMWDMADKLDYETRSKW